jgi:hypothetical protein
MDFENFISWTSDHFSSIFAHFSAFQGHFSAFPSHFQPFSPIFRHFPAFFGRFSAVFRRFRPISAQWRSQTSSYRALRTSRNRNLRHCGPQLLVQSQDTCFLYIKVGLKSVFNYILNSIFFKNNLLITQLNFIHSIFYGKNG